jgi:hypothetical protein
MGEEASDSDSDRRKFAEERSHRDADISNENVRATAQAAILINGGAATAILAFLAKTDIPVVVGRAAPWCLIGYALGVSMGAGMMYCSIRSLDCYQMYWRLFAHGEPDRDGEAERKNGMKWWTRMRTCFYASMIAFLVSSCVLGVALFYSKPTSPHSPATSPSSAPPPASR